MLHQITVHVDDDLFVSARVRRIILSTTTVVLLAFGVPAAVKSIYDVVSVIRSHTREDVMWTGHRDEQPWEWLDGEQHVLAIPVESS